MDDKRFELIKKLTETQSTSGFEHNIRSVIREEITPYVDEVEQDGLVEFLDYAIQRKRMRQQ